MGSLHLTPQIKTSLDPMGRKSFLPLVIVSIFLLLSTDKSQVTAANMRSFIEAVRRKATVVYVGSVKRVDLLTRTKFDIKARTLVSVSAVVRGPVTKPPEAIVEYSSFDQKTPCWRVVHSISCGLVLGL